MITSKQIVDIVEKWLTTKHSFTGDADVFVNPSSSDYIEIRKNCKYPIVRFFADNKYKKVYVWDSNTGIHKEVANELKLLTRFHDNDPNLIAGEAGLSSGKAVMEGSDMLTGGLTMIKSNVHSEIFKRNLQDILKINWSWTNPYIDCSKYLAKFKNDLDKVINR